MGEEAAAIGNLGGVYADGDERDAAAAALTGEVGDVETVGAKTEFIGKVAAPAALGLQIGKLGTFVAEFLVSQAAFSKREFARGRRAQAALRADLHELAAGVGGVP